MSGMIVVTGASRGMGAHIVHQLVLAGYHVGCLSRSGAYPDVEMDAELTERCFPIDADVASNAALRDAFEQLGQKGVPIIGLVNNAGLHEEAWATEVATDHWDRMMQTNALAVVTACQLAFPHLRDAGGGLIVNIGSNSTRFGVKRLLAYTASKAAVEAITRVLAVEWAAYRISVLNVAPGLILTDMSREQWESGGPMRQHMEKRLPSKRPGAPEEIGAVVAGLFRMNTPFLTGETICVDGGHSIAV